MKRQGDIEDFRSNLHQGGCGEAIKLSTEERKMAIKAAKTVGLKIAGVDLIRTQKQSYVIEINSSPGLEGIEAVSQVNVAGEIINYIEKNATKKVKGKEAEKKDLVAA
jgi:ribosomal protein S6--L-glutamate ligase